MISFNLNSETENRAQAARIAEAMDEFLSRGGNIQRLSSFSGNPLPPVRSDRVDPETVLKRRRISPTRSERKTLRKLSEAL